MHRHFFARLLATLNVCVAVSLCDGATITVTSTADAGGSCPGASCTLRQAIATAASGDTINFSLPANSAIILTSAELLINKNLTITGAGANLLTVQRSSAGGIPAFRIFNIAPASVTATISGLTIANGNAPGSSNGGGISSTGTLTITNSILSGNSASGGVASGGAIYSTGTLTVTSVTISGNAANVGGGIRNEGGTLTITTATISGNSASIGGGGIFHSGTSTITNSTISGNMALGGNGGGIVNSGPQLTLANSTISGNTASGAGGGVNNFSGTVNSRNTIIALNTAGSGPDFNGALTSQGFNLIGNNSGATITPTTGDQIGVTAAQLNLGPLQDNGGPTLTRALLSGSTAIERGDSGGINTDQRGFARPVDSPSIANVGDGSDIGAYEVQAEFLPGCDTINRVVTNNNDSGAGSLRDVIVNVCSGSTVTFAANVRGTINLTSGQLTIARSLTINGPGANLLTVQRSAAVGTAEFRIFNIAPASVIAIISGLTIANGRTPFNATGTGLWGGGIYNTGTLTLTNVTVSGNSGNISGNSTTIGRGGGITNNSGRLIVTNSTISGNQAGLGGGIYGAGNGTGTVTVSDSTISGNFGRNGGGIGNFDGAVSFANSTLSGNTTGGFNSGDGGGIYNSSSEPVTFTNSTISGNSAGFGGGIYNGFIATVAFINSTISGNSAAGGNVGPDGGGGISNFNVASLRNTIIALNTSALGPDVYSYQASTLISQGFNLIGNNADAAITPTTGDQIGTAASPIDPLLGQLQDNGGPTLTLALLSGSTAIDKGESSGSLSDQRGFTRPLDLPDIANASGGDGSDIGAFEFGGSVPPVPLVGVVSRKFHGGAGPYEIDLLVGSPAVECRTGGTTNDHTVVFKFLNPLTSVGSVSFTGVGGVSGSAIGADAHEYIVSLTGVANAQVVTVTLNNVTDSLGNSSSTVGAALGILLGDTTGNGSVTASDIGQTKAQSGQPVTVSNFRTDVTANNAISASDIGLVKSQSGAQLP